MSTNSRETEVKKAAETIKLHSHERRAILLYLAIIALSISTLSYVFAQSIWEKYFKEMDAITTPFGILYLDEPNDWVLEHEQCHQDRLNEVGPIVFYVDYLTGGACIEELRCGAPTTHPACSEYPLSHVP